MTFLTERLAALTAPVPVFDSSYFFSPSSIASRKAFTLISCKARKSECFRTSNTSPHDLGAAPDADLLPYRHFLVQTTAAAIIPHSPTRQC